MNALILLGHGSRAPGASFAMERIAETLRSRRSERIEVAHMELANPSLVSVLEMLHSDGCLKIILVPYFLHRGVHLREDIPQILSEVCSRLPSLEIAMAPHLGYDDALVEVIERRVAQAELRHKQ